MRECVKWALIFKAEYLVLDVINTFYNNIKYTNITTKLKWKVFNKVIKSPSEEAWV